MARRERASRDQLCHGGDVTTLSQPLRPCKHVRPGRRLQTPIETVETRVLSSPLIELQSR